MAWGCFCWIPCPYKKWNEEDRPAMLAMLPLLGACIGIITGFLWWVMILLGAGQLLIGAVVAGVYFLLTGFIHLDGYMDCCDAVLPRHPDIQRRREILKDSHTGAFGAIALALMLAIFIGSVADITDREYMHPVVLMGVIATLSRSCSALDVLNKRPMETSQYDRMSSEKPGRIYSFVAGIIAAVVFMAGVLMLRVSTDVLADAGMTVLGMPEAMGLFLVAMTTVIAAEAAGSYDRKALGGMNGDISGHMIVTGEMFGLLAAALIL